MSNTHIKENMFLCTYVLKNKARPASNGLMWSLATAKISPKAQKEKYVLMYLCL